MYLHLRCLALLEFLPIYFNEKNKVLLFILEKLKKYSLKSLVSLETLLFI
jgi:hypothetical protein